MVDLPTFKDLTVELPLKAIVRGYSWTVVPITWRNRRTGRRSASRLLQVEQEAERVRVSVPGAGRPNSVGDEHQARDSCGRCAHG